MITRYHGGGVGAGGVGKNKDFSHVLRKNKVLKLKKMRIIEEYLFKFQSFCPLLEIMDQKWQKFQKHLPPALFSS